MQWEYLVGHNSGADEAWLNELGVQGWELVSVGPMLKTWIFKRPKVGASGVSLIHPPRLTCCHCGEPIDSVDLTWESGGKQSKPRHRGCVETMPGVLQLQEAHRGGGGIPRGEQGTPDPPWVRGQD